jgi:Xaa-Pro aminopeptidase
MRPGVAGHEVDAVARGVLEEHGVAVYTHALGHQIGRTVHDGGTTLAPLGDRYGTRGAGRLEVGEVYTLEPVVHGRTGVDGHPIGPGAGRHRHRDGGRVPVDPPERLTVVG